MGGRRGISSGALQVKLIQNFSIADIWTNTQIRCRGGLFTVKSRWVIGEPLGWYPEISVAISPTG